MVRLGSGDRIGAIDFVKAIAIVAVAFTHSGEPPWTPVYSRWDFWLCGMLPNFQVPAFLLVSGFLYFRPAPIPSQVVWQRLIRVVVPYLIASTIAYGVGLAHATSLSEFAFQLATGSTLGIYYFIFLLALFVPTIWVLSRLPARAVAALCIALWAIAILTEAFAYARLIDPDRKPTLEGLFWLARSPLNFTYAMFVSGWLAAHHRKRLMQLAQRRRPLLLVGSVGGIALFVAFAAWWPWAAAGVLRMIYTLSVVVLITLMTSRWHVPAAVHFLSVSSLGLYLYHHMVQAALQGFVHAWWPPTRILTLVSLGLLGAAVWCRLGIAALGARARVLLGA